MLQQSHLDTKAATVMDADGFVMTGERLSSLSSLLSRITHHPSSLTGEHKQD
jgi:hypothetical protein